MIPRSNLHTHSKFSDGHDTPEAMVLAAIDKGFVSLGFSEHAWAPYDGEVCIKKEDIPLYFAEIARLKERYADRIEIYTGFEVDCYETTSKEGLDYTIGSAHYLRTADAQEYYPIDYKPELFEQARDRAAGGDMREMLQLYYDSLIHFIEWYRPDIVGHLDLITKLNDRHHYFDPESGWYRTLMREVAERVAATGCILELNTGGIARGYKEEPYPCRELLGMLRELKAPILISSDAHSAEHLDYWFDEAESLLREVGFRSVKLLQSGHFVDVAL